MTRPLSRRVLQMALVWAFIGQWVGADIGMRAGGLVGSIAGCIAVMAEMAVLGAFLGSIGASPRDTIIGAVVGLIVGVTLVPPGGNADLLSRANIGLIAGASDGAALRPYLRMLGGVLGAATRRLGWAYAGIASFGSGPPFGASRGHGDRGDHGAAPAIPGPAGIRPVAPDRSMEGTRHPARSSEGESNDSTAQAGPRGGGRRKLPRPGIQTIRLPAIIPRRGWRRGRARGRAIG